MTGLLLCGAAFVASFWLGRRSLVAGLGAVLTTGYLYGIVRANFLDTFTYFLFDAAVVGFYLSVLAGPPAAARAAYARPLTGWVKALLGWTVVMTLLPLQHPFIQLVGLRGNGFLLPFLLVGGWLQAADVRRLALGLALLNLMALGFGAAEYFRGVPAFYPPGPVTDIIYRSNDVANYTAYRIPACFAHSAPYGSTMLITVPWLLGSWVQAGRGLGRPALLAAGLAAAVLGIFLCASRSPVILLGLLLCAATLSGRLRRSRWVAWVVMLAGVGYVVMSAERLQRFLTLADTERIATRVEGSVNMNLLEIALTYPMGNGMGAGGTSIPFFLSHLLTNPVGLENEYSRILLEQGLVGLGLWLAFIAWVASRWPADRRDPDLLGRRLLWFYVLVCFATAILGIGMLTTVPTTVLFLLSIGHATTWQRAPVPRGVPPRAAAPVWAGEGRAEPARR